MRQAIRDAVAAATVRFSERAGQGVLVPGGLILTAAHVVNWTHTGSMALGDNAEFVQKIETARGRQLLVYPLAVEPVADLAVLGALDDQWHPDGAEAFEQFREATRPVRLATAELPFDERKMGPGVITVDGRKVSSDLTVRTYRPIPAHVLAHTGQWISGRVRQGGADAHKLWFDPYSEPIEGGTSGGPVVAEEDGLLLGVVSFTSTGTGAGRGGMIPRPHLAAPVWLVPRMLDAPAATATAMAPR